MKLFLRAAKAQVGSSEDKAQAVCLSAFFSSHSSRVLHLFLFALLSCPGSKAAPRPGGIGSAAAGQPGMEGEGMFSKILPGGAAEQAGKLGEGRSKCNIQGEKTYKFSCEQIFFFLFQLSLGLARSSPHSSEVLTSRCVFVCQG